MCSSTLRTKIIASFNNPLFDPNTSLLEEVPFVQALHNHYPPLHSLLSTPSELPSSPVINSENSQFIVTPLHFTNQNSPLPELLPLLLDMEWITTLTTMTTPFTMPMCNEHAAPTFDSSKPREILDILKTLNISCSMQWSTQKKTRRNKFYNMSTSTLNRFGRHFPSLLTTTRYMKNSKKWS